jgi:hypothetical protein
MIEMKEGTGQQCAIFWTAGFDDMDWMGCVYRDGCNDKWQIKYRFRDHVDDKVFDSADTKRWTEATVPASMTAEEISYGIRSFVMMAVSDGPIQPHEYDIFTPPNYEMDELSEYLKSGTNKAMHHKTVHSIENLLEEADGLDTGETHES